MSQFNDHAPGGVARFASTDRRTARQWVRLHRGMDAYERRYSSWQRSRRLRDAQAEVRLHVVEAQLARLRASDRMGTESDSPVLLPLPGPPVVFPISAYRP